MSTYGISGTSPLQDLPDDPEVIFETFLKTNWNDSQAGVNLADIDFGFEPDAGNTKQYIIKIEEVDNEDYAPDLVDKYTQNEYYMNCHIWERDMTVFQTTAGMKKWKMRAHVKRLIKQNCRDGISVGGTRFIKHLYLLGGGNAPEPERTDWHHTIVTFKMVTWTVTTV